jgi:hypothetical protein
MTGFALGTFSHSREKMLPSAVTAKGLAESSAADTGLDTCGGSSRQQGSTGLVYLIQCFPADAMLSIESKCC